MKDPSVGDDRSNATATLEGGIRPTRLNLGT